MNQEHCVPGLSVSGVSFINGDKTCRACGGNLKGRSGVWVAF